MASQLGGHVWPFIFCELLSFFPPQVLNERDKTSPSSFIRVFILVSFEVRKKVKETKKQPGHFHLFFIP